MSDPISNMLTSIRNAGQARLPHATVPHSRLKESIARLLLREGYVAEVAVEGKPFKSIKIKLKYTGRKSVIEGIRRVSSPGLRAWGCRSCPLPKGS
jgi:small subunit ribosomal protein S8